MTDTERLKELTDFVVAMRNQTEKQWQEAKDKGDDFREVEYANMRVAFNYVLDKMSAVGIEI